MNKIISIILTALLLSACGGGGGGGGNTDQSEAPPQQSQAAKNYVAAFIAILREHALTRYETDWPALESEVNNLAKNATTIPDTYPALTRALELIKTNHSLIVSRNGDVITYPSNLVCSEAFTHDALDNPDIGYVRVDGFSSPTPSDATTFAQTIQNTIAEQDNADIKGWIVDLRNNTGGNMWPMIAGLGPLFNQTLLGYFVDPDNNSKSWGYQYGASILDSNTVTTVDNPYLIINPSPKIAVLSSKRVGSSGEAVLVAFKKQENVRFFGTDSCGLSTANTPFELSDNNILLLTTSIMADREHEKYGGKVLVDQAVSPSNAIAEAVNWINSPQ